MGGLNLFSVLSIKIQGGLQIKETKNIQKCTNIAVKTEKNHTAANETKTISEKLRYRGI